MPNSKTFQHINWEKIQLRNYVYVKLYVLGLSEIHFFVNRQSKSWKYVKLVVDLNDDFKQHIPNYMYVYIYTHM